MVKRDEEDLAGYTYEKLKEGQVYTYFNTFILYAYGVRDDRNQC